MTFKEFKKTMRAYGCEESNLELKRSFNLLGWSFTGYYRRNANGRLTEMYYHDNYLEKDSWLLCATTLSEGGKVQAWEIEPISYREACCFANQVVAE